MSPFHASITVLIATKVQSKMTQIVTIAATILKKAKDSSLPSLMEHNENVPLLSQNGNEIGIGYRYQEEK